MIEYIPVIMRRETIKLATKDVLYIEQNLRKTIFFTNKKSYETYSKISDYTTYLGKNFIKCHRSLYINLDNVVYMGNQRVVFADLSEVSLGRDSFTAARQHFSRYIISE